MYNKCVKCGKHPVEYVSPGHWCRYCWVDWWVSEWPIEDREKTKLEYLEEIEQKYGKEASDLVEQQENTHESGSQVAKASEAVS
jgi:hypothetical protein